MIPHMIHSLSDPFWLAASNGNFSEVIPIVAIVFGCGFLIIKTITKAIVEVNLKKHERAGGVTGKGSSGVSDVSAIRQMQQTLTKMEERVEALDAHLWTWRDDSFLPHGTWRDAEASQQPIVLTASDHNPNGASVRFLVDGAVMPADPAAYQRLVLLFDGEDPDARDAARALLGRIAGQRLEPIANVDARRRWRWRNDTVGRQQPVEHRLAVLRFEVQQPGEQANARLDELAGGCGRLILHVRANLALYVLGLEHTAGHAGEQLVVAAKHTVVHATSVRLQLEISVRPLLRLRHRSGQRQQ